MKRAALARKASLRRGSSRLKRTALLRPDPSRRKQRQRIPQTIRDAVKRRSGGRCVACSYHDDRPLALVRRGRRIEHLHHVLPVGVFPDYELIEANLVGVCVPCHDEHERAHRRIPWEALPSVTVAWALSRGGREAYYLERTYPRRGTARGGSAL